MTKARTPAALIVGHPGHELRLHHWLELARPLVFVLTDGSGSQGHPRVESTRALLAAVGATRGSILGAWSDADLYRMLLERDVRDVAARTIEIADAFVRHDIEVVVADARDLYNPAHDLCRVIADLAVERAEQARGAKIASYDYAVIGAPDATGRHGEQLFLLDDDALERKIEAAHGYVGLRHDVEAALRVGVDAFRLEVLRPVDTAPRRAEARPHYERAGEEYVRAGRFTTVLRRDEHFLPFVTALTEAVRSSSLTAATR